MMPKFVPTIALTAALFCLPNTASADPLRVTSGAFVIDFEGDFYRFAGSSFALTSLAIPENLGLLIPKIWGTSCFVPQQDETCQSGETLEVSFQTPADAYLGIADAVVDGTAHSNVTLRGSLSFDVDPVVLPELEGDDFAPVTSPFVFEGLISGFAGSQQLFAVSLFGSGTARVPLFHEGGRFFGEEGRVDYVFADAAPVPEPASWLLLATGVAGMMARRRRRAA